MATGIEELVYEYWDCNNR